MNLRKILKEEIESTLINEVIIGITPTEYTEERRNIAGVDNEIWLFKSELGNEYELEYMYGSETRNILLDNNKTLYDTVKSKKNTYLTISLAYTVAGLSNQNRINPQIHNQLTNRNEEFDLLRRINYLIQTYMNIHPEVKIYTIGLDSHLIKLKLYKDSFTSNFSKDYTIFEGTSSFYNNGAYYFIKNDFLI